MRVLPLKVLDDDVDNHLHDYEMRVVKHYHRHHHHNRDHHHNHHHFVIIIIIIMKMS